jgi:hypothetical protein
MMKAQIKGPMIPAMDVIVRCNERPVTRSAFRIEPIKMIWEAGPIILWLIACHRSIRIQIGQVVARKRSKVVGRDIALPTRYSRFIFVVESVNHPEGMARTAMTAWLMLVISPNSTVDAPKRLMKMFQYSPLSIPPPWPKSLPIASLAINTL